jgi:hypothetical protein
VLAAIAIAIFANPFAAFTIALICPNLRLEI